MVPVGGAATSADCAKHSKQTLTHGRRCHMTRADEEGREEERQMGVKKDVK